MKPFPLLTAILTVGTSLFTAEATTALAKPKIIALTPHSVEMLYAIGAGEQIVGTVAYADYPEAAKQIKRIGQYNFIDFEQVLLLQPDLIVLDKSALAAPLLTQLNQLGIAVFDSSVTRIDAIAERLVQLGHAVGAAAQAESIAAEFKAELTELRQRYQQRPKVTVFWQISAEPLITSANGWQSQMINDCGGENVFDGAISAYPQVNIEQVLIRQPQVIIQPEHAGMDLNALDWQRWPEIPAVAQQQIHTINADLVSRPSPRLLQGLKHVCEAIEQSRSVFTVQSTQ